MIKRFWILICLIILAACTTTDEPKQENEPTNEAQYINNVVESDFAPVGAVGFVQNNKTTFITWENLAFRAGLPLTDFIQPQNEIAIFLANGETIRTTNFSEAIVGILNENVSLGLADGTVFHNIAGVIADPPEISIIQAYYDMLYYLQSGERVMVIVLDGWGWEMHHYFADVQPFLAAQVARMAHTVFPPFTPVAMSSIFTGQTPNIHGVHDRATRTMSAPDIFEVASSLGYTSTRVQGGVVIVQTSERPVLVPNLQDRYATDQSVFDAAMSRIDESDLLFIHFNSIDDAAHTYGPYASEVAASMALLDDLVQKLVEARGGIAIITADHGQHLLGEPNRMGDHLWVSHEDIFVPYIVIGGR